MFKKILLLAVTVFTLGSIQEAKASHYMGGEITWECIKSGPNVGKYIFTMKLYRDCTGCNGCFGATETINTNVPGLGSMNVNQIAAVDISPTCFDPSQGIDCDASLNAPNGTIGAVAEYTYRNAVPVTINGTPPASGWAFWFTSNARNSIVNTAQTGSFTLRAKMYPYNGQLVNPCFDSSPQFLEAPSVVICIADTFTYNHNAADPELDSLYYDWAHPLQGTSGSSFNPPSNPTYTNFATGFSHTLPLPNNQLAPSSPVFCPQCLGPSLDNSTGEVFFYADQGSGGYTTVIKVEAWKCGQLVAEIYREIQITLLNNCGANNPPSVSPPFGGVDFDTTVVAGDLVQFTLAVADPEFRTGAGGVGLVPQNIEITASGNQFGNNYSNVNAGCLNPPCATLSPTPQSINSTPTPFGLTTDFSWQTDCSHLATNVGCGVTSNKYNFVVKLSDDFCPAPAIKIATVSITVLPGDTVPPVMVCSKTLPNGDYELNWAQPIDTGQGFDNYHVYEIPAGGATSQLTPTGGITDFNQQTFVVQNSGANPPAPASFYVRSQLGCGFVTSSTDTIQPLFLQLTATNNSIANLSWNALSTPLPPGTNGYYKIYKEVPAGSGSWALLDSTQNLMYVDTINTCSDSIAYRVELDVDIRMPDPNSVAQVKPIITVSCSHESQELGRLFQDAIPPDSVIVNGVSLNSSGVPTVEWVESGASDFDRYEIWESDPSCSLINLLGTETDVTNTEFLLSGPITVPRCYAVVAIDSCGNPSLVNCHCPVLIDVNLDGCGSEVSINWNGYVGIGNALAGYQVMRSDNGAPYAPLTGVIPVNANNDNYGRQDLTIAPNNNYCYQIAVIDSTGATIATSDVGCGDTQGATSPSLLFLTQASVEGDHVDIEGFVSNDGTPTSFSIQRADFNNGIYRTLATIPATQIPQSGPTPGLIEYSDFSADVENNEYFYRVVAEDTCGETINRTTSNQGRNILLRVTANGNVTNTLNWNHYIDWEGDILNYEIYRSTDDGFNFSLLATVDAADSSYLDDVASFLTNSGTFCYYVVANAAQGAGSLGQFDGSISKSNSVCSNQRGTVFLPTAFEPASGHIFKPVSRFTEIFDYEFYVMNRWGQKIYSTNNAEEGWDGTYKAEPAEAGVYMYHLKYRPRGEAIVEKRGSFTLIR